MCICIQLLSIFLADKIESLADGSRSDGDDTETRIKSALAILYLAKKHKMKIDKQLHNIFEGLRLPASGVVMSRLIGNIKKEFGIRDCQKLVQTFRILG